MRWPDFAVRADSPELMDDLTIGGDELVQALRELRLINALLGAAWPTLEGVLRLWWTNSRPARLNILDVGAGLGDANRLLLRWAEALGVDVRITLIDIHPETCAAAARYYTYDQRVNVVCGDVLRLPLRNVDIVTAALFLHHIADDDVATVLQAMLRAARLGVVVNDLHRHPLAWAAIRLATGIFSRNRMIRHDAALSVRRGFRHDDFARLQRLAELSALTWRWRPFFRYLVIASREEGVGNRKEGRFNTNARSVV
jgi:SAM-dependent methyltransferase